MADIIVDLTNYKDKQGSKVPDGTYTVAIEDYEQAQSKAKNQMIILYLRIVGGDQDGMTLVDRLTFTDGAMFRVVNFMQAFGLPTPRKRIRLPMDKLQGRLVSVEVAEGEPFNGRTKSEVKNYLRAVKAAKAEAAEDLEFPTDDEPDVEDPAEDIDELEASADEVDEVDEVEEAPEPPKAKAKAKPKPAPEPVEDDVDIEDIDIEDLDVE